MATSSGAVLVGALALVLASVGIAFANAANPLNDSKGTGIASGTVETLPDHSIKVVSGSVAVQVGGTWDWGTTNPFGIGVSPQKDCTSRYGVGWAVDWLGLSSSQSPNGLPIQNTGQFFHVLGNTMDGEFHFTGPCAPENLDSDGFPKGPWSAAHTYNAPEIIPAAICVNMYDLHGTPGSISKDSDHDPTQNRDNSVRTNDFNPAVGHGSCFNPRILNLPTLVTHATDGSVGSPISDTATLSGAVNPTGKITFNAYSDANCTTKVFGPSDVTVNGNGDYGPVSFTPTAAGQYKWRAEYSGDNSNAGLISPCGDTGETSTVGNKPDVKIVKSAPAQVTLGDNIPYTLVASNTGSVLAPNVVVTDDLPATTTLVSLGAGCSGTTTFTCNAGDLAVGASKTFTFTVKTTQVGTVDNTGVVTPNDDTPDDNTSTVHTVVNPPKEIDVAVVKSAPTQVVLGDNIPYTITATNTGNTVATNTIVKDDVPATTTLVSVGAGCSGTTTITCDAGDLAVGASKTFTFTVKTTKVGTVDNTAVVTPNDKTPDDNTSTVHTIVSNGPVPDLAIVKTVDAAQVVLGSDLNYTLKVTNTGSEAVSNGVVKDTLPDNVNLVTNDPGCTNAGKAITCNVPNLGVGDSKSYTLKVHPTAVGTVTNTATVGPDDTTPGDNTSTVTSKVVEPDLKIVKAGPATVSVGDDIPYTLTVTNTGTVDATNVTVTDNVPAKSTFKSASPECGVANNVITCTISSLAVGASKTLSIVVTANEPGTVTNTAVVSPNDSTPEDNTSTVNTTVNAVLAATVTPPPATPAPAEAAPLPRTGSNPVPISTLAAGLLFLGFGLVLVGDRRRLEED